MPKFSQSLFDTICDKLGEGESLRSICASDDMPSVVSFFRWVNAEDDRGDRLSKQYARARETQADTIFDECLQIADTAKADEIAQARLQIDTRKWMAGKMRPKVYGEKVTQELVGAGGGALVTEVQYVIVDPLDEDTTEGSEMGGPIN